MSEKLQQNVVVQKDLALATGESLGMYSRKVSEAGSKFMKLKLNLVKDSSIYPVEIFSKSVIFSVSQWGPNIDQDKRYRYFAAAYSRNDDGTFEFSGQTEVEQVVGYSPKSSTAVTKSAEAVHEEDGWRAVQKTLWNGVL